jgi:NAD(P)-dependent dehydrogenase (short-subunit alcohol dehydrogenase family)
VLNVSSLADKLAMVTGAGQGLGRAIALELAAHGATLAVADLNAATADETVQLIRQSGGVAEPVVTDVACEDSVRGAVAAILARHQRIDILVNNAGLGQTVQPLIELSREEFDRVLAVNLVGTFVCSKWVCRSMIRHESGAVVNISSLNGLAAAPLVASYNAAKAGVISLTQTLAMELAPYGIRVNAVAPGPVYTDFNRKVMHERAAFLGITEEQMVERVRAAVPLGRWGTPQDIAHAVHWLCSDHASWVTGQVLPVTGGLSGVAVPPPKRAGAPSAKSPNDERR